MRPFLRLARWVRTWLSEDRRPARGRLRLEALEERTLFSVTPAVVAFDAASGWLVIHGGRVGSAVQVGTSGDALRVSVDGQLFSPAGSAAQLRHIQVGGDSLTLAGVSTGGDLDVQSSGAVTLAGPVRVGGQLSLTAASVTVSGSISAAALSLHGAGLLDVEAHGSLTARAGGSLTLLADNLVNVGRVQADGSQGGEIRITARDYLNGGTLSAVGSKGMGGAVSVSFRQSYIDTSSASTSANGIAGGGRVSISGRGGRLFSSGRFSATGRTGGQVDLVGRSVALVASTVDASGSAGKGGRVVVWSQQRTDFTGSISAVGAGGAGGFVEVSSHVGLSNHGKANVGAGGTLRLDPQNLVISAAPTGVFPQFNLINPGSGGTFGTQVVTLSTGNVVVTDPTVNNNAGAVYLFNGTTGALLASLTGQTNDEVGGVTALSNGNYVVASPAWNHLRGAVTWASGTRGITGVVSAANSLVGSTGNDFDIYGDQVGHVVVALSNGNYVVDSPEWNSELGAVTWGSGTSGITGTISASNSLVGSNPEVIDATGGYSPGDLVGHDGVTALSNGNYVVDSVSWNNQRGAVTWGSGISGIAGTVSASNSLVGSAYPDHVGFKMTVLSNGNYVVVSPNWNGGLGAATWASGASGITGTISASNSLVGSASGDSVGFDGVTALSNGNYVVDSSNWQGGYGAVTWSGGTNGITGTISASNSLIGSPDSGQGVGDDGVLALSNGNYVVDSDFWNEATGAVTWGNGTSGTIGTVTASNSLVGSAGGDLVGIWITPLSNGDYVVDSPYWNGNRGAVTWASGTSGITGTVSASNSLVGTTANEGLGSGGVTALSNGNYVVSSPHWNGGEGAVTWSSGATGITGTISAGNSLVGSSPGDLVGGSNGTPSVVPLSNGNYVVPSPYWNGYRGAATWGSGTSGITGIVSASNSLVGSDANDFVGMSVTPLTNGNYVASTGGWNSDKGAATWGSGTSGITGPVSPSNSLVGAYPGYQARFTITPLSNGNYVVQDSNADNQSGAATWVNGSDGTTLDGQNTIDPQTSIEDPAANAALTSVQPGTVSGSFLAAFPGGNGGAVIVGVPDPNQLTASLAQDQTVSVTPDFLTRSLDAGTAVDLQAGNTLTVGSPITVSAAGHGGALTLEAGSTLLLEADINPDGGALTLGGTVSPFGSSTGIVQLAAPTAFKPGSTCALQIQGVTPGTQLDQLQVTGAIDLSNATLNVSNASGLGLHQSFVIVQSSQPITTPFAGLPEGGYVSGSTQIFRVSYQNDRVTLTNVSATFTFSPATLVMGQAGTGYRQTITATGGTAPYTFTLTSGALPAGLSLSSGGVLSGTPTKSGTFHFNVQATDHNGLPTTHAYALTVKAGAAARVTFLSQPRGAHVNQFLAPFAVRVLDRFGNPVYTPVTLMLVIVKPGLHAGFGSGSVVQVTPLNGVATFRKVSISVKGTYRLVAHDGLVTAESNPFTVA